MQSSTSELNGMPSHTTTHPCAARTSRNRTMLGWPDSMRWLMISRSTFLSICKAAGDGLCSQAGRNYAAESLVAVRGAAGGLTHWATFGRLVCVLQHPYLLSPLNELYGHQLPRVLSAAQLGHAKVAAADIPNLQVWRSGAQGRGGSGPAPIGGRTGH